MGVVGTFCQLCGMPTQHDHYVPTGGMLKIYRGAQPGGGHDWAPGETPFAFGPEHAWLLDAVVLPWDEERVLRGAIEDGVIDDGEGDPVMVWDGGDDGLALHHACWELQGSPRSTGPAVRANDTHAWTMVEGYHEQLFEFAELARDGKAWMLEDPRHSARNRARIEAMREAGKREIPAAATSIEEILAFDRDWAGQAVRRDDHTRRAVVRARAYALEAVPKGEFTTLLQLTRKLAGPGMPGAEENAAVEDFEVALKAAVERDARAVLALAAVTEGRAAWFVYSRDATATRAALAGIDGFDKVELGASRDPDWSEAMRALQALRGG